MKGFIAGMMLFCCCSLFSGGTIVHAAETTKTPLVTPVVAPIIQIDLDGVIAPTTTQEAITFFRHLDAVPKDQLPSAIVLKMNSPGGEFESGFLLAKAIESSKVPVVCIVDGKAYSMAFYVLQSCTRRVITARSSLMMHQVTLVDVSLNMSNIHMYEKRLGLYNNSIVKQLARRLKLTELEIAKFIELDWYMDPVEALKYGAVDTVID